MVTREDPPLVADERSMLDGWLDFHRATLLMKCDGLPPAQLRARSVPPSSMSLLGLVRHMAEVERNWFRRILAGEEAPPRTYDRDTNPDGDFDDVDTADIDADFAFFSAECEAAREIVAAYDLDHVAAHTKREPRNVRWIMVHMIEEYARHNGHADFLRETIDGSVGD